jgi:hypothetical protein
MPGSSVLGSGSDAIQRPFCRRSGTGGRAGSWPEGPAFSLSTPGGQPMSLASLTDKGPDALIVLRGYPGYQCPYCVRQVHDFVENGAKFRRREPRSFWCIPVRMPISTGTRWNSWRSKTHSRAT